MGERGGRFVGVASFRPYVATPCRKIPDFQMLQESEYHPMRELGFSQK